MNTYAAGARPSRLYDSRPTRLFDARQVRLFALVAVGQLVAIGLARLLVEAPLPAFGALYAFAFCLLAARRPDIALLITLGTTPMLTDLSGGGGEAKFSITEINLLLLSLVFFGQVLFGRRRVSLGPISFPIVLYLAACGVASYLSWRAESGPRALVQTFIYIVITPIVFAWMLRRPQEHLLALCGLLFTGVLLSLVLIVTRQSYVLGLHKNGSGSSLSMCILVATELCFAARDPRHKRLLLGVLAILIGGIIITLSRGGWLAALSGLFVITMLRREWKLAAWGVVVLLPVAALVFSLLPQKERNYAFDFDPTKRMNLSARLDNDAYAKAVYAQSPIYGVGVGLRKEYDATNLAYLTLAETGWIGLISLGSIFVAFAWTVRSAAKRLSRSDPLFTLVVVGAACMTGKLMHGMVDHYWTRGALTVAWGAAGMTLQAWFFLRARDALQNPLVRERLALEEAMRAAYLRALPSPMSPIATPISALPASQSADSRNA